MTGGEGFGINDTRQPVNITRLIARGGVWHHLTAVQHKAIRLPSPDTGQGHLEPA